jgi:4-amino-4-deoxy-L-arabinose transferase-like glycosyltransferase
MNYRGLLKNRVLPIFLVALILRLGYIFLIPQAPPVADAVDYDTIAINMSTGHGFSLNPDVPTPKRPPGLPFMLAAVYSVVGHSYTAARTLMALLGALTCLLAFRTAEKLFGERVAAATGWILALYPVFIAYHGLLLTETPFTFLLAGAVMFWVYGASRKNAWDFAISGLFLGLATLTRPVTLVLPGVLLVIILLSNRALLGKWFLFTAVFLAVLAPWSARNYRLWGTLKPCSVGTGFGFYLTGNMATGLSGDESMAKYLEKFWQHQEPTVFTPGESPSLDLERKLQAEGSAMIKAHPGMALKIALKRLPQFWITSHSSVLGVDKGLREYYAARDFLPIAVRLALLGFHAFMVLLAAAGIFFTIKNWRETAPLLALLVLFTGHVAFDFVPRYHLPVIPYLFIFSAAGLLGLMERYSLKK